MEHLFDSLNLPPLSEMVPGGNSLAFQARKGAEHDPPQPKADQQTPTSFFLANELDVERSISRESEANSTFGVRSLQDTGDDFGGIVSRTDPDGRNEAASRDSENTRRRSTLRPYSLQQDPPSLVFAASSPPRTADPSPQKPSRRSSPPSASESLTSLSQASHDLGSSLPSSPKSISNRSTRPSDEDSLGDGSQAILSSEDEAEAEAPPETSDSVPQLIMPSIKMPSRRPFTARGKDIGRLKILIAGDSGRPIHTAT